VVRERLARLDELGVIAVLEFLEDLHGQFDGGWSDGYFEDIGHTE
jgi:hypothetical protein